MDVERLREPMQKITDFMLMLKAGGMRKGAEMMDLEAVNVSA